MEGKKDDKNKVDITLLDLEIRSELETHMKYFRNSPKYRAKVKNKFEPEFLNYLREMVRNRLYIAAAAAAMMEMNIGFDDIIKIYMGGAKKYAPHNWKKVRPVDRYLAAAYRHISFDDNNDDFGGPHLAYFVWNMIALRWFERHGIRLECDVTTTQCEFETIPRVQFRDGGN